MYITKNRPNCSSASRGAKGWREVFFLQTCENRSTIFKSNISLRKFHLILCRSQLLTLKNTHTHTQKKNLRILNSHRNTTARELTKRFIQRSTETWTQQRPPLGSHTSKNGSINCHQYNPCSGRVNFVSNTDVMASGRTGIPGGWTEEAKPITICCHDPNESAVKGTKPLNACFVQEVRLQ